MMTESATTVSSAAPRQRMAGVAMLGLLIGMALLVTMPGARPSLAQDDATGSDPAPSEGDAAPQPESADVEQAPQAEDVPSAEEENEAGPDVRPSDHRAAIADAARWRTLENPEDPAERWAYLRSMFQSMQRFLAADLQGYLYSTLQHQEAQRRDEVAFRVLWAILRSRTSVDGGELMRATAELRVLADELPAIPFARFAYGEAIANRGLMVVQATRRFDDSSMPSEQIADAMPRLTTVAEAHPNFAGTYRVRGILRALQREQADAISMINRAIDLAPNDSENWRALRIVMTLGGRVDAAAMQRRMGELGERVGPRTRIMVYGAIVDVLLSQNQYTDAHRLLIQEVLPAAIAFPEHVAPNQWPATYVTAARLASAKTPPDFEQGFRFLDEAMRFATVHQLRIYPIAQGYFEVVARMLGRSRVGIDAAAKAISLLDAVFASISRDALTDQERGTLLGIVVTLLGSSGRGGQGLSDADRARVWELYGRARLWSLTVWVFEQQSLRRGQGGTQLLNLALEAISAAAPIEERPSGRMGIDPARLREVSETDLRLILRVMMLDGLVAERVSIRYKAADYLGHTLAAMNGFGDFEAEVVRTLRSDRFLNGPASDAGITRARNVCRVLRIYPIEALARPLIQMMTVVVDLGDRVKCQYLFYDAHPALNTIVASQIEPGWAPTEGTTIAEFERIRDAWRARFPAEPGRGGSAE